MSDVDSKKVVVEVADCLDKRRAPDGPIHKIYLPVSAVVRALNAQIVRMLAVDGVAADYQYVEPDNVSYGATISLRDEVGLTADVVASAIDAVCTAYRAAYDTEMDVLTVIEGIEFARPAPAPIVVPPSLNTRSMRYGMGQNGFPSDSPFASPDKLDGFWR